MIFLTDAVIGDIALATLSWVSFYVGSKGVQNVNLILNEILTLGKKTWLYHYYFLLMPQ